MSDVDEKELKKMLDIYNKAMAVPFERTPVSETKALSDNVRKFIYKIELHYATQEPAIITIATVDKTKLPELIETNKLWFEQKEPIAQWKFKEELNTWSLSREQYLEEIAYCDVNDGID